jgi:AcrR family transcriptional regulator
MYKDSSQTRSPYLQKKREAMIQNILETARAIMREQGVAALSMQELARRMNMRAPSLYHYFGSKMDVYDALFQLGISLYRAYLDRAYQGIHTWQAFIQQSFESYMTFAQQNPELYQLCFERPVPGFVPSEESMRVSRDLLEQSYERAQAWKKIVQTDLSAQQMVDLIIAVMHGLTALHMSNEPEIHTGQGRFGSLIPAALALFEKAWS